MGSKSQDVPYNNTPKSQSYESLYKLPHIEYPDERQYWNCELMCMMQEQMYFSRQGYDVAYIHAFKRIDEIWNRMMYDYGPFTIDTKLQRMALASHLRPIYNLFEDYLQQHKPGVFAVDKDAVEFHSFHEYLTQHGFNEHVAREYIAEDMSDPYKFDEIKREVKSIYDDGNRRFYVFSSKALQSQNIVEIYPQSIERYRYLFSKPNVS